MRAVLCFAYLVAALAHPQYRISNPVSHSRKVELLNDVKSKVKGVAVPLLTFYTEGGEVDHAGMASYVRQLIDDGCVEGKCIILAVASGGDFPSLSIAERKATAKTVIDAGEGRVPMFLSVQESHLADTLDLSRYAEEIGYYGIQVSVPYYWTATDGDAIQWFEAVHNATSTAIMSFYNTPWEGYDAPIAVLKEVAKLERVRVLKLFTSNEPMTFRWTQYMLACRDDFAIIDNTLQPVFNHMHGGTAFITHLSSVWPAHELELFNKLENGDYMGALQMYEQVNVPWYDMRIRMGGYTSGEGPPVKAALLMAGRVTSTGPNRLPSRDLTPELLAELRSLLVRLGVPGVAPEAEVELAAPAQSSNRVQMLYS